MPVAPDSNPLMDPATLHALERVQEQQTNAPNPLSPTQVGDQLRRGGIPGPVSAAIAGQLELRQAAASKFGDSARYMLFTRDGLEQATRFQVALWHAQRLYNAGVRRIADLGCGIGTESLAFATRGLQVLAVELDPLTAQIAAHNLRPFPDVEVLCGDVADFGAPDLARLDIQAVFLDPARRGPRGRRAKPADWSPSWDEILRLTGAAEEFGVKVAPGIDYHYFPAEVDAQWTSVDGSLVEAAMWSPGVSPEGPGRSAVVFVGHTPHSLQDPETQAADAPVRQAPLGDVATYLYEPDPAIIRSGLVAALAEKTDSHLINPRIAYLASDQALDSPFWRGFEVRAVTKLRLPAVQRTLRDLGAGHVEVKKRGADIDPNVWQRQLSRPGGQPAVVIATRIGAAHRAIVATRIDTATINTAKADMGEVDTRPPAGQ